MCTSRVIFLQTLKIIGLKKFWQSFRALALVNLDKLIENDFPWKCFTFHTFPMISDTLNFAVKFDFIDNRPFQIVSATCCSTLELQTLHTAITMLDSFDYEKLFPDFKKNIKSSSDLHNILETGFSGNQIFLLQNKSL